MFPFIFAIAVFFGAIAAIRRNPSYTTGSILRSIPIILLAIGAVIGLIIATVHFTNGRPTPSWSGTIVIVSFLGCFFLIYVIYTVTTPKDARLTSALPSGATLVHIHRRKVYLWAKIAVVLLLVCGMLKLALPTNAGLRRPHGRSTSSSFSACYCCPSSIGPRA